MKHQIDEKINCMEDTNSSVIALIMTIKDKPDLRSRIAYAIDKYRVNREKLIEMGIDVNFYDDYVSSITKPLTSIDLIGGRINYK